MLSMLLELITTLKICLPIALLIGFIFGYLYTKLKMREIYQPDIKKFSRNIHNHTQDLKKTSHARHKLKGEIENYEFKLKGVNESILESKNQLSSQKSLQIEIVEEQKMLNAQYKEKKSILAHYIGEIDKVKKECRLDDVSNIEENKESMKRLMKEKESLLKEKRDDFSMIQHKVKGLDLDNRQLENRFHELGKGIQNISTRIKEKEKALKFLESGFSKEYEKLYRDISFTQANVKELKKKLIKLKETY